MPSRGHVARSQLTSCDKRGECGSNPHLVSFTLPDDTRVDPRAGSIGEYLRERGPPCVHTVAVGGLIPSSPTKFNRRLAEWLMHSAHNRDKGGFESPAYDQVFVALDFRIDREAFNLKKRVRLPYATPVIQCPGGQIGKVA